MEALIQQLRDFYRDFDASRLGQLDGIYAKAVIFKDPVHELQGLDQLHHYMAQLGQSLQQCQFDYLDQLCGSDSAYIKWDMRFRHPALGSKPITVRGMSQLQARDGRIIYHEDCYDLGAMLYEQLPLVGAVPRWLRRRLAMVA